MSQTIDQVVAIKTHTESSKSELSSGGKRPFKVYRWVPLYGCWARQHPPNWPTSGLADSLRKERSQSLTLVHESLTKWNKACKCSHFLRPPPNCQNFARQGQKVHNTLTKDFDEENQQKRNRCKPKVMSWWFHMTWWGVSGNVIYDVMWGQDDFIWHELGAGNVIYDVSYVVH